MSKEIIGAIILLVLCVVVLNFTCNEALNEMNENGGLKSVIEEIWEGKRD